MSGGMTLVSQLPMALKAIYVDGWKISRERSDAKTGVEFLDVTRANTAGYAGRDFGNDQQMKVIVRTFFNVLRNYVDEGELRDICEQLPESVANLIEEHA